MKITSNKSLLMVLTTILSFIDINAQSITYNHRANVLKTIEFEFTGKKPDYEYPDAIALNAVYGDFISKGGVHNVSAGRGLTDISVNAEKSSASEIDSIYTRLGKEAMVDYADLEFDAVSFAYLPTIERYINQYKGLMLKIKKYGAPDETNEHIQSVCLRVEYELKVIKASKMPNEERIKEYAHIQDTLKENLRILAKYAQAYSSLYKTAQLNSAPAKPYKRTTNHATQNAYNNWYKALYNSSTIQRTNNNSTGFRQIR